jgi:ArsR family transcriptional regulator
MDNCPSTKPHVRRGDLVLLATETVAALVGVIKALSDPIRVQMVHLLEQRPDLCTCEFEEVLGLGQSKVSYHLKILLEAGLVTRETYGTWSHYRLAQPAVVAQLELLVGATVPRAVAAD